MAALVEEELVTRLATWLGEQTNSNVTLGELTTPAVGQSNDTVLFDATFANGDDTVTNSLVLRRQPTARQLFLDADVVREGRILQGLASTPVPTPSVRWLEVNPDVIGAPFFVMERIHGTVPAARPSIHTTGWLTTLTPSERRTLWESALETFVAVHAVEWRNDLSFLSPSPSTPNFATGRLEWLREWYRWSTQGREFPLTDAALAYLENNMPAEIDEDPVLLWGDPRVGNILFSDSCHAVGALDWENAWIGHRAFDVAHWLFFDAFAAEDAGIERLEGFPGPEETLARYQTLSGVTLPDLGYYEIAETFFIAVTLIRQADISVAAGKLPPGTTMGHGNNVTRKLARLLGLPEPELSPDYLAHRGASTPPANGSR